MKHHNIDKTDKIILIELQRKAITPIADLAERAGLSPSSCHRRVKLLEQAGIITGYTATLDGKQLGLANEFFVEVSLSLHKPKKLSKNLKKPCNASLRF